MIYKSFLPGLALNEFVRNYTVIHFQFRANEPVPFKQRSPKPEQKMVFYLKASPEIYSPATGITQTPPQVSIFSHQSDKKIFKITNDFFAFLIYFQPGVLHRLIRLPMIELLHESYDAELFFGREMRAIREQLATATNVPSMIAIVEKFLLSKCRQLQAKSSIDMIAQHLLSDPTAFSLDKIAQQSCLSTKQFYRRFIERIGISPKLFSRLSRFNHAYRYKISHPTVSWSAVAQEYSYTDYHHLEKEFKAFTGLTPEKWTATHLASPERILKLR